jgi:GT2 family glycosyltransferase
LRSFPHIFVYELKKFSYILFFETKTLKCLKDFFSKLPKIYKKRKEILKKRKIRTKDLTKWFDLETIKRINKKSRDVEKSKAVNPIDLSIIILNYKTKGLLRECLKEIRTVSPNLNYEIIVVDNGSNDGTAEMMKNDFSDIKFVASCRNLGYAAGNNLGIKESRGRYVMIMNSDIIISTGSLEKLVSYMDNHSDVGVVGPKLLNPDRTLQDSCYRLPSFWVPVYRRTPLGKLDFAKKELDKYLMKDWDHNFAREVDWLLGGCLLISREALNDVGLLDERYFAYYDDVDLCRSMWENKWRVVYYPEVSVIHFHRRESADGNWWTGIFKKVTRIHIKSWITYSKKWGFENEVGEVEITKI